MNQLSSGFQNFVETLKSFATLFREAIIVVVIAFILLWPANFKQIMQEAGITGVDLGIVSWAGELEESQARLEDANQVMEQYQQELAEIKTSVNTLAESPGLNAGTRAEIEKINNRLEKTYEASALARDNIENNIIQQSLILTDIRKEQAMPPPPPGKWAVVAGADREVDAALFEVNRLKKMGYESVQLWRRSGWFRTVILFGSREAAENNLKRIKAGFRETAFITDLDEWCPNPKVMEEGLIYECRD